MKLAASILALSATALVCNAQTPPAADPTLDTTGVPFYVRILPRPAPEPWVKITPKQRFQYFASQTFTPFVILGSASGAAISQGLNSPKEWGQGWEAYGKRVGTSYGGTVAGNTVQYAAAAALHEDNRYFRAKGKGFKSRVGNVIISPFVAHNDQGGARFSTSGLLGMAGTATIPLAWSPPSWRTGGSILTNASIWYGVVAGVNLAREFFPDLVKKTKK
jgi:hypothetical protein